MYQQSRYDVIVIDDQQDANILSYLCIPNQLYMFRAMYSPIIRGTWLYFTASGTVHRYCCRLVSWMRWKSFPAHPWHRPAALLADSTRICKVHSNAPDDGRIHHSRHVELIRNKYINQNSCILLAINYYYTNDARTHERQIQIWWVFPSLLPPLSAEKTVWIWRRHICQYRWAFSLCVHTASVRSLLQNKMECMKQYKSTNRRLHLNQRLCRKWVG